MSTGSSILWLVIDLGLLYLTPVASQYVVNAILGQEAILPCEYLGWSQRNSMCWGRGPCPNSKCNDQLVLTDGMKTLSRKSDRYSLRENIQEGNLTLTISSSEEGDSGVYCCRIEVPGWFNDVKNNIHLKVIRDPTVPPTSGLPITTTTTTTARTTPTITSAMLSTTEVTTLDLTTRTLLQATTTSFKTVTTYPPMPTCHPEVTTVLISEESTDEGATTAGSKAWALQPTSTAGVWETSSPVTLPQWQASETAILVFSEVESKQEKMPDSWDLLVIIAPSMGFLLLAVLVGLFLRGSIRRTYGFQKHTRLSSSGGDIKNVLSDMPQGREEEDGLFTL
ncbi:T-cell immunoglobulin and mucin domain-containing protein 4 isoform X2 [Erinaceus europaeus]|uniref:T-cell immunoglobulin and mucin domain-containing protein 4 isoform X2 n=1 Tax=Erinaceus europaeus TaxID=9365 RepID=UPI0028FC7F0C|nr:T-cell immunoglobulin and mucin domain-containing protein 4 isoform X2 [Erinaceus europaeus]